MSASKLKNIVILALLLLNAFLLLLIVPNRLADLRSRQQTNEALAELYAQADVTLPAEIIPADRRLYATELFLDKDAAVQAVELLLGQQPLSQEVKTGTHYTSKQGSVLLSRDGSIAATLYAETTEDPHAHAVSLLREMGISHGPLQQESSSDNWQIFSVPLTIHGTPIVTDSLHFYYHAGALSRITGRLLIPSDTAVTAAQSGLSPQDALVSFLRQRMDTGWMGSAISAVTQGYALTTDDATGRFFLQPVCHIVTDAGRYLVDGITGAVTLG